MDLQTIQTEADALGLEVTADQGLCIRNGTLLVFSSHELNADSLAQAWEKLQSCRALLEESEQILDQASRTTLSEEDQRREYLQQRPWWKLW